jgi:mRNA interferase RelE/StbE
MGISFKIQYHKKVAKEDIPRLPRSVRSRVKLTIAEKLTSRPEVFGKPLRKSLKGYRKLRVGDYRVVFRIVGRKVKILIILHRKEVYKHSENRIETKKSLINVSRYRESSRWLSLMSGR